MREDLDALAKRHPDTLRLVYTLDKADKAWAGACSSGADAGWRAYDVGWVCRAYGIR